MEPNKVNWNLIESYLAKNGKDQVWLAHKLDIGRNAVTNWKKRGGAPASQAKALAIALGAPVDELLGSNPPSKPSITEVNEPLSSEARELILCVRLLDGRGEVMRQMFAHHKGLLVLSAAAAESHDWPTDSSKRLAESERKLTEQLDTARGQQHAGKKHNR